MSYVLKAVIARRGLLRAATADLSAVRIVDLRSGMALLPMTDAVSDLLTDASEIRRTDFWNLPAGFDRVLAESSRGGSVAYVESEYFAGVGEENAAVWLNGKVVLGPLHVLDGEPEPVEGTPICRALRELGVSASESQDEFTAVGLDQHRDIEAWLS